MPSPSLAPDPPQSSPAAAGGFRPVRAAIAALLRAAPQLTPKAEKLLWRTFYEAASLGRRDVGGALMNYGYAPLDGSETEPELGTREERFGLALYAQVAGSGELSGKEVLEVGCGRGGGTAFVFEQFQPRSMVGLDLAKRAIGRCRARYARPGLEFVAGDAENLPFGDGAFDAVLSVESTHCYADVPRFLSEAARVLRPGGLLLLADFRHAVLPPGAQDALMPQEDVACLREQLAGAGFETLQEQDITPNVVRALQLDTPIRRQRIERRVPKPLRRQALAFAAIEGSPMYQGYAEGKWIYVRFVLQKAKAPTPG